MEQIPEGFLFSSVHCGIRRKRKDLGIIYSLAPCSAAGTFTTNTIKAAPVVYTSNVLERNNTNIRAVIVNSGVANSCTGELGLKNAIATAEFLAKKLMLDEDSVLVASTGLIGVQLPMDKIINGIEMAVENFTTDPLGFAEAITTTDTTLKLSSVCLNLNGKKVKILGIAKGSGMIHPNMATMLAFILTDAKISPQLLKKLFKESVDQTYNMIDVDGDTSTNDMALILANGFSDVEINEGTKECEEFFKALNQINMELARKIVEDGEGASKVIEVEVLGAPDIEKARKIARTIASSNLVKTAIHLEDLNWGRILAAAGYSGVIFDYSKVDLYLLAEGKMVKLVENGCGCSFDEETARSILAQKEVKIVLDLKQGQASAKALGCDLTEKFIEISGRYKR
ncbi:bifunctional glutamate N-acetyltransferase/amino-acid acetyltransferase ArgJ [Pseudothermotoga thermarum]|uniref:Arginine biosynthesis bifunctional protein ArgJ n=1 Tax=Pseudothermotoga thermarum DSM 5069 TaxID=688269 RepID=F7YU13_9THEM|nr:bifunctional glutamate N-acetyltransferase/amino-acid acetyltransferase ArgJ [Pseudothermotoga thermarum]AEH51595.1 N-acetylglutamate synthase; glutamate N-acetyltransferase [Pseudothermotoga thermarum DSM 5069]